MARPWYNVQCIPFPIHTVQYTVYAPRWGAGVAAACSPFPAPLTDCSDIWRGYKRNMAIWWQYGYLYLPKVWNIYKYQLNYQTLPQVKTCADRRFITRPRLTGRPDWLRVANTSSHSWNYVKTYILRGFARLSLLVSLTPFKLIFTQWLADPG